MAGNILTIELTAEQQRQIREATGKKVTELYMELVPSSAVLSDTDLDKVAGGFQVVGMKTL